jgi:hypothetical protein
MGERGNIVFLFEPAEEGGEARRVYFYTHWRGHLLNQILREAMNWRETWPQGFGNLSGTVRESCRWYDASYFARVVFCRLVAGEEDGVLSFGIDVDRTLPDYDELHVDVKKREIRQVRLDPIEDAQGKWTGVRETVVATWTLDEFAAGVEKVVLDEAADLGVQP